MAEYIRPIWRNYVAVLAQKLRVVSVECPPGGAGVGVCLHLCMFLVRSSKTRLETQIGLHKLLPRLPLASMQVPRCFGQRIVLTDRLGFVRQIRLGASWTRLEQS